jgi:hypothetical protein
VRGVRSTTEGEDKPLKYPSIFFKSELMVLTKIDNALPAVLGGAGERECATGAFPDGNPGSIKHHGRRFWKTATKKPKSC